MNLHLVESYLSNLDKHRHLRLPDRLTPDLALEMGIDLGDGCLFSSPTVSRRGSYYVSSVSQRFPDEWFGVELVLKPLVKRLYNLLPKSKRSSLSRNGINMYTYSRGLFFFKSKVLGLPTGPRSRNIRPPSLLSHHYHQKQFWTGYQYADGSFYCTHSTKPVIKITSSSPALLLSLRRLAVALGVRFTFGSEHGVAYSLRVLSEGSIMKWVENIPLINPVHMARFFLWRSGLACPPGLHLSQYVDLALGVKDASEFDRGIINDLAHLRYLEESVLLTSLASLAQGQTQFDDWWRRANLASRNDARRVLEELVRRNYVRESNVGGKCCLDLQDGGLERLKELDVFLRKVSGVNRIKPAFLNSEEGLIYPMTRL